MNDIHKYLEFFDEVRSLNSWTPRKSLQMVFPMLKWNKTFYRFPTEPDERSFCITPNEVNYNLPMDFMGDWFIW